MSALLVGAVLGRSRKAHARPMQNLYAKSYLHVEGAKILTGRGQEIKLRGLNLGGWLVTEAWMCGFTDNKDAPNQGHGGHSGRFTWESLAERFGAQRAATLQKAWEDNWLTSDDLDQVRDWGFNVIRVPFSFRTLQNADGSWILNADGEIDFARMDWIVAAAATRGIFTIFVLHVWPEQREHYDRIARPEGRAILSEMSRLWTVIAEHYKGNGAIAGFDVINELPGNWGAQLVLTDAIRAGDPNRVVIVEGFTLKEFADRRTAGMFVNSIFSEHLYKPHPMRMDEIGTAISDYAGSTFPVYVGEFLAADFRAAAGAFNAAGASWSSWTYKTVDMGDWGAINYHSELRANIQTDSYATLLEKWSGELASWRRPGARRNVWINESRLPSPRLRNSAPLS